MVNQNALGVLGTKRNVIHSHVIIRVFHSYLYSTYSIKPLNPHNEYSQLIYCQVFIIYSYVNEIYFEIVHIAGF